jgi:hypothetical protein
MRFIFSTSFLCVVLWLSACRKGEPQQFSARIRDSAPLLPQRAYIWQRDWNAPVAASLAEGREVLDGCVVLGAEIEWRGGNPRAIKPRIDWQALRAFGKPVSVAMRIAPFPGPFSESGATTEALCATARELTAEAKSADVPLAEFQLDFDCAQKKLAGYAQWVRAIRRAVEPVPLVITTLPSWLPEPAFPALASEARAYVLQVHSVASPRGDENTMICNPAEARQWVAQAAKLGLPFEIALPTYRSVVGYSPEGKLLGVVSDSVRPTWPPGTQLKEYSTDAAAMAALVAEWQKQKPAQCRGLLWYRLPVATDENNWRWPTLRAVMAGRAPKGSWAVRVEGSAAAPAGNPNPADFVLTNDGETDGPPGCTIVARWEGGAVPTAEGLPGWEVKMESHQATFFPTVTNQRRLPPGEECAIGWLRLEPAAPLHVEVVR